MKLYLVSNSPGPSPRRQGKQRERADSVVLTSNPKGGAKQPSTDFVPHTARVPVDSPLPNEDGNHDGTGFPGKSH